MFDDAFFRISPVEAQLLDPQQRMMLEVTWQALEDAGIDPERIRGSRTGVYSGISNDEYRMLVVDSAKPSEAASCLYALSGTNLNGTAGRVSFVLGLTGPAKAVDAACASAMVAINDAVADLQQGKANLAIAGGVQAILNGRIYELRADAMMLSPDGQCKTFDAVRERVRAGGGVRGGGAEATQRSGGGRRPDLGRDPGLGGEPRRDGCRPDGAEHARAGTGDGGRAVATPASIRWRWTTSRRTAREPRWAIRSRSTPCPTSTAGVAGRTGRS